MSTPTTADLNAVAMRHVRNTLKEQQERRTQLLKDIVKAAETSIKKGFDFSTTNAIILANLAEAEARVRELTFIVELAELHIVSRNRWFRPSFS